MGLFGDGPGLGGTSNNDWILPTAAIAGSGLLSYFGGQAAGEATNQASQASQANAAADRAQATKYIEADNTNAAGDKTSFSDEGGFRTDLYGPRAELMEQLKKGDLVNQNTRNAAGRLGNQIVNRDPYNPAEARSRAAGVVDKDDATKIALANDAFNRTAIMEKQRTGGTGNSNYGNGIAAQMPSVISQLQLGGGQKKLDLEDWFRKQHNDQTKFGTELSTFAGGAPTLAFPNSNTQNAAMNARIPSTPAVQPDATAGTGYGVGAGTLGMLLAQYNQNEARSDFNNYLNSRQVGNSTDLEAIIRANRF